MPRLLVLNGSPGVGKSTLARRYAEDHPLALVLDIDLVRAQLGRWSSDLPAAGTAARELAISMAATHLRAGHDVVVPQLVARPGLLERLEELAIQVGAAYFEIVVTVARDRVAALAAAHPLHRVGPDEAVDYHDRLQAFEAGRRHLVVERWGGIEDTYQDLVEAVGDDA